MVYTLDWITRKAEEKQHIQSELFEGEIAVPFHLVISYGVEYEQWFIEDKIYGKFIVPFSFIEQYRDWRSGEYANNDQ